MNEIIQNLCFTITLSLLLLLLLLLLSLSLSQGKILAKTNITHSP